MIIGIGNDIIEISRVERAMRNNKFLDKYFTIKEKDMFEERSNRVETIAGNFAVKESVSKMLGTGIREFGLIDIEILRDAKGKPYVELYNVAKTLANELGISSIHVSISHSKENVIAFVIGERSRSDYRNI